MSSRRFRALIEDPHGYSPKSRSLLHLIEESAEASLCGIPRSSLIHGGIFNEFVCTVCSDRMVKLADKK